MITAKTNGKTYDSKIFGRKSENLFVDSILLGKQRLLVGTLHESGKTS